MLTLENLKAISSRMAANPNTAASVLEALNAAMTEGNINTPQRIAAFVAQCLHESGEFKYTHELWGPTPQQLRYERPVVNGTPEAAHASPPIPLWQQLGNTELGDGHKYAGSGAIQITGRYNHKKYGVMLGLDLINHPELARDITGGLRVAVAFWVSHGLNQIADLDSEEGFIKITHVINGGTNGLAARQAFWHLARTVLSLT